MSLNNNIRVTIVGATGQFGHPLTFNLASEGADVLAIFGERINIDHPDTLTNLTFTLNSHTVLRRIY